MAGAAAATTRRCIVACHVADSRGGAVAINDSPIEFEVASEDFVVTPALARLLVKLAKRHLEWESLQLNKSRSKETVA